MTSALSALWLDSGEYEGWARRQLENPSGEANANGIEIVTELNKIRRTYYSWFQDNSAADFAPRGDCPRCGKKLGNVEGKSVCEQCNIVLPNNCSS